MGNVEINIKALKKLIKKSEMITHENHRDRVFKIWIENVREIFIQVFGENSIEFNHFSLLRFKYHLEQLGNVNGYASYDLKCFRESFKILISSINEYIVELEEGLGDSISLEKEKVAPTIFISHCSKDSEFVNEVIEILETVGVDSNKIFCTSFDGYGIGLGDNFLDAIKDELSSNSLVIFILSKNFYKSPVCLCEMGAAWVLSKNHIPILIPPLDYVDVKGVIPLSQGFKIDEESKINLFKDKVEEFFSISSTMNITVWEKKRDKITSSIKELIERENL